MAHSLAVSKELSAFADQFILSEGSEKVKHFFAGIPYFFRLDPYIFLFPQGRGNFCGKGVDSAPGEAGILHGLYGGLLQRHVPQTLTAGEQTEKGGQKPSFLRYYRKNHTRKRPKYSR